MEFVQNTEFYKGYKLVTVMTQDNNHLSVYHRSCYAYDGDELLFIGKNKKQCKKDIDDGIPELMKKIH